MVTDNELSKIMQLRANGRTHQEIADEIGISRSTVAYQLTKLKEKEIPDDPIQIIIANSFEPNMTTVTFTSHEFEKHRKNQQLYAAGRCLFELRGDVIHKTEIPSVLDRVEDYPEIARIIRKIQIGTKSRVLVSGDKNSVDCYHQLPTLETRQKGIEYF